MHFATLVLRPTAALAMVFLVIASLLDLCMRHWVSGAAITETRMWVIKRRILLYARRNNCLPRNLVSVPPLPGFDNSINDAWQKPIRYHINGDGTVALSSFGADETG
ncbi:MAG TPA: hypothetical protein VFA18_15225 [Gemmataceae bacterium]|nr:hypothetical protein [Gemmataceae bacterium]